MSIDARWILERALALPAIDRAAIVDALLASLDEPDPRIDEARAEEARRRIAAYDAGEMKAVAAEEMLRDDEQRSWI